MLPRPLDPAYPHIVADDGDLHCKACGCRERVRFMGRYYPQHQQARDEQLERFTHDHRGCARRQS